MSYVSFKVIYDMKWNFIEKKHVLTRLDMGHA